ncbi:EamA family transporter [Jidongwangia harbinensis]|uniref:EamA family transporter n=1 Tax=Jidongwangia harbinensis TaxID=2878561 RepID=UPI001CD9B0DD|nr:EamA family transporter [Jidongwangia harbinensis]MCA2216390.1 EamA family transporter [Jidongwangia harbinensis]
MTVRTPVVPAPLLVLTSIASIQFGGAFARTLFEDLGAAGVTVLRLTIAALVVAVATRPRVRTWSPAAWTAATLLGVTVGTMNLLFYLALRTVPLGILVTVASLGPLLLALVQTRRLPDLTWAALAAVGVVLLGWDPGATAPAGGLLLGFAAGLCGAGYILLSARLGRLVPGTGGLAVSLAVASLLVLPFGAGGASAAFDDPALLLGGAVVAVLCSVLPSGLELHALRRMPTRVFGILMSLQPAGGAIAGLLVLDQRLRPLEILALVLVMLASAGVTVSRRAPVTDPPSPGASPPRRT